MATESELRSQLASLKAEGKTESTSKKAAKIADKIKRGEFDSTVSGGSSSDFSGSIQKAMELSKSAIQPAVDTLKSGIDPLKERYSQLLEQIKGNQKQAEDRTTLTQSNELGRRGILPSSGLYDQTIEQAVNPVTQQYTGLAQDTAYAQDEAIRAVNQAIANLQAGAGQSGINTALQMLGLEQSQNQFNTQQDLANKIYENVTLPESQYKVNAPYYKPEDTSSVDRFYEWLANYGNNANNNPPTYKPNASGYVDKSGNWMYTGTEWVRIVD